MLYITTKKLFNFLNDKKHLEALKKFYKIISTCKKHGLPKIVNLESSKNLNDFYFLKSKF